MDRRQTLALLLVVGIISTGVIILSIVGAPGSDGLDADQQYPDGAGPNHIDFATLDADEQNVSHAPRVHWDSYTINYTAPPDRPVVEGEYFLTSSPA